MEKVNQLTIAGGGSLCWFLTNCDLSSEWKVIMSQLTARHKHHNIWSELSLLTAHSFYLQTTNIDYMGTILTTWGRYWLHRDDIDYVGTILTTWGEYWHMGTILTTWGRYWLHGVNIDTWGQYWLHGDNIDYILITFYIFIIRVSDLTIHFLLIQFWEKESWLI